MIEQTIRDKIQLESLNEITKYRCSGLNLSVGLGKTKVGLMYIEKTQGDVLIVVPKLDIIKSWTDDAIKFSMEHIIDRCTFVTYRSLLKYDPSSFSTVILEEAHNTKSTHEPFLSKFKGNILGLTGTPPKKGFGEKGEMMMKYYPIRYSYTTDQSVDNDILNDYRINVYFMPLSKEKNIKVNMKSGKHFFTSERDQYNWITNELDKPLRPKDKMFKTIQRLNLLKQFQTKLKYIKQLLKTIPEDEKVLIFSNTIEQAEMLCEHSHHSGRPKDCNNLELFNQGVITRLSAVEQLSEGINIKDLKHVIILHTYSSHSPKQKQKFGRAMRLSKDQTSTTHILCYSDTVDEYWVKDNLKNYNQSKIKYFR
jgi:superfamily II DNA or RNA helicase